MNYRYRATEPFWENFYDLSPAQKESVRRTWPIFKQNPFDPRLGTHKIHKLSALYQKTIYDVEIEADLRAVFFIEGDTVWSVDIGTHDILQRLRDVPCCDRRKAGAGQFRMTKILSRP